MSDREELLVQVKSLQDEAESLVVRSKDDYEEAAKMGKILKDKVKEVQTFFKPMKEAAQEAHKKIVQQEKDFVKPLEHAIELLKKAMGEYVEEQEKKRKEAEEIARKEAMAVAQRLLEEAAKKETEGDMVNAQANLEKAEMIDEYGRNLAIEKESMKVDGSYVRKDWQIVSVDPNKVPISVGGIEIRPVDMGAVMKLIRMSKGQIKIEGIEFKEVQSIVYR